MAQQKFSNSFREALWETYGKKCFHCTGELLLADMQVDHIIPEEVHRGTPDRRANVLAEIGLPTDFDILGDGNMAPSCGRCNGQKSGSVLIGRASAVALTRIAERLPILEANLQKKRGVRELEDVLRVVVRSLEGGKFTPEEFLVQFNKLIPATETTEARSIALPTGTILNWSAKSLGFTAHARQRMQERRLLPSDIAAAVYDGLSKGTATAIKDPGSHPKYLIAGEDGLEVAFTIRHDTVIVLTAYDSFR